MESAGAPRGPRSRSAVPGRQLTPCPGSPASSHGLTLNSKHGARGRDPPSCLLTFVQNVEFSLKSSLQLHQCSRDFSMCDLCHGESRLGSPCPACTAHALEPSRPQDKSLHRQPHLLDSSPYACAPCGRGFSQKQALLHHQQAGCSEPPSPSDIADASSLPDDSPPVSEGDSARSDCSDTPGPSSSSSSVIMCQFCPRTFRTEAGLQRHEETCHGEDWLMAAQGKKTKAECTGSETRKGVNSSMNGEPNTTQNPKKKFLSCRSCDMVFRSTAKLYVHRKEKHSRDKTLGENQGQSSLSAGNETRIHVREGARLETKFSHAGRWKEVPEVEEVEEEEEEEDEDDEEEEREFPCPSCAEVFSLQSQLKEHIELHQSSVKRRQCSVCTHEMDTCKWPGSKRQRLYHCVPCHQGFSALDSFLEHCQEHLRVRVEEDSITEGYTQQARKA
ncbi:hypothetical protein INR49_000492 [Caranx melampygus]|nr:hypothetical protein INR49_000492 [Caranx melampygus]